MHICRSYIRHLPMIKKDDGVPDVVAEVMKAGDGALIDSLDWSMLKRGTIVR